MKGISFSDMRAFYAGSVNPSGKSQELSNGESFLQVFDKTQGTDAALKTTTSEVKTEDADSIQNHANVQKKSNAEPIKETKDATLEEENVEEAVTAIKEKIADLFNVSIEEVERVLETLGISVADLLNTEVLSQVVMALNPEVDALQFMTNEELYADLKSLTEFVQGIKTQLCEQFQISEEELKAALENFEEMNQKQPETMEVVTEIATDVVDDENLEKEETRTIGQTSIDFVENAVVEKAVAGKQTVIEPISVRSTDSKQGTSHQETGSNESGQEMFKNFFNQLSDAVENANASNPTYGTSGREIINQITDYIKVHVNPETTEMELQLHPASLGTVRVQLASTGGVLTAIFTTENETVKAALETQLIQLKENFTQQGLRVESIEVNVSTQGFERSLDQQQQEGNSFEGQKEKKSNRRISLSDAGSLDNISMEDIAEEDKVVADMMIRNGNTVDYTV